jgi:prevent-host-death family protein
MKTLEIDDATAPLADYARRVKEMPVVLTFRGKPVAALVSITNADSETVGLSTNDRFRALIERSRTRHKVEGGISPAEMRERLRFKNSRRRK